jgi:hypothetical protein
MNVFKRLMRAPCAGNRFKPRTAPIGMPTMAAIQSARQDIFKDNRIMPNSSASRCRIREKAFENPSKIMSFLI